MNDADIVRRVLAGDTEAFAGLVDAHAQALVGLLARHVPGEWAVELAHDAFVRAFERLSTYRGRSPFFHWLARIGLRLCADFWRVRARSRETPFSSLGQEARQWLENLPCHDEPGMEQHLQTGEVARVLDWALGHLSSEDRMALTMIHVDGHSQSDVAALLGWSTAKVRVRTHRARRKLRGVLAGLIEQGGCDHG